MALFPEKILFVDDDELMAEFVVMTIRVEGHTVQHCTSGKSALQKVSSFTPDLILLDVQMPEMDGIEAFHEFKKKPLTQKIPIIFLTGNNDTETIDTYYKIGALGVIGKPFNAKTLCKTISEIWNKL